MEAVRAWLTILRFGVAQAAVVAGTVLPITTLPRIMQNELGFLAIIAGSLVGIYYAAQLSRLLAGALSDRASRRMPFIVAGLVVSGVSGVLVAYGVTWLANGAAYALPLLIVGYVGVGVGVGTGGTTLFALVATTVSPRRRAPAATIVWFVMIAALAITTVLAGKAMTPFTYERLTSVATTIAIVALIVGTLAVLGIERGGVSVAQSASTEPKPPLSAAFATLLEPGVRNFALFVFISMFAYNMQELVFEAFLGARHGLDAGESTSFSGYHKAAVPLGMLAAAIIGRIFQGTRAALLSLTIGGCLLSASALISLGLSSFGAMPGQLIGSVAALGFGNGLFAGGALASMFAVASSGAGRREGTRMGAFGLAQAVGFGIGMFAGAAQLDVMRTFTSEASAFASVFLLEAAVFVAASILAIRLTRGATQSAAKALPA